MLVRPQRRRWTPSTICLALFVVFLIYLLLTTNFALPTPVLDPLGTNTHYSQHSFHLRGHDTKHGHPIRGQVQNSSNINVIPIFGNRAYRYFSVYLNHLEDPPRIKSCWMRNNNGFQFFCRNGTFSSYTSALVVPIEPKIMLGPFGAPLMVYKEKDQENRFWIHDARAAFSSMEGSFTNKLFFRTPIQYQEPAEVVLTSDTVQLKHWSSFLDAHRLYFIDHMSGTRLHLLKDLKTMVPNIDPTPNSCLKTLLGRDLFTMCGASNALKVTFCTAKQECPVTIHNTVYFATFHLCHEKPTKFQEHYVVTWNISAPYNYISLSSPFNLIGTPDDADFTTVSMYYNHQRHTPPGQIERGFLDTSVGFVENNGADFGYTPLKAARFLDHHTRCPTPIIKEKEAS